MKITKKKCGSCKRQKNITDFWVRSDNGKRRNTCKGCQRKQANERKK